MVVEIGLDDDARAVDVLAGPELAPVEARRLVGLAVVEGGGAAVEQRVLGVAALARRRLRPA